MVEIVRDPLSGLTHEAPPLDAKPRVVVLLDASGSMSPHREAVVSTFNEYVESVRDKVHSISLYTFDSEGIKEKIRNEHPSRVRKLHIRDYVPSALTPLYDAMGKVMSRYEDDSHPIQFVTHTDGAENYSKEWTFARLKEYMDILTKKGWLFVHLGEGIEGREQMAKFHGLKMQFDSHNRGGAMRNLSVSTAAYARTRNADPASYTGGKGDTIDIESDELPDLSKGFQANVESD